MLTYPAGLLTADEIILAGGKLYSANEEYYLNTGLDWWSLSPVNFDADGAGEFVMSSGGGVYNDRVYFSSGVRPSVSLKPGVKLASGGNGTSATPYEFVLE